MLPHAKWFRPAVRLFAVAALLLSSSAAQNALAAQTSDSPSLDPERDLYQYVYDRWTLEDGLPHNAVRAVAQTPDGYLWLGTNGGLVRFDGARFKKFSGVDDGAPLLGQVLVLHVGRGGALWVGTSSGGLTVVRDGRFTTFTTEDGLPSDYVEALYEAQDGTLWIGTNEGLARLVDGLITAYPLSSGDPVQVTAIHEDRLGRIWIGTWDGAVGWIGEDGPRWQPLGSDPAPGRIGAILEDRSGDLWIGSSAGLSRVANGHVTTYPSGDQLPVSGVNALFQDRAGTLWIGSRGGVTRLVDGVFSTVSTEGGLVDDRVWAFTEDLEGSLWVGTYGGLSRMKNGRFTTHGRASGLDGMRIASVIEARDGAIWVGTGVGGAHRLYQDQGVSERFTEEEGLPSNGVRAVFQDGGGAIWFATAEGLVHLLEGVMTVYTTEDGLAGDAVSSLYEDRDGSLWIGTSGHGVSRFSDGVFATYRREDGLAGNFIRGIEEDRQGTIWFATDLGVSRWHDGTIDEPPGVEVLRRRQVRTIHEDADGVMWIGSVGAGLVRIEDGQATTFTTTEGLFDNDVWHILEDDFGRLWMCSDLGIFSVRKSELRAFAEGRVERIRSNAYGLGDGMKSVECNGGSQPSALKFRDGRLAFPTQKGVVVVDPAQVVRNRRPPPVVIEELLVDRKPVPLGGETVLAAGSRDVEFRFTSLSLMDPGKVRFRYRLEGYDEEWVEAGNRRIAYYTNLPPGGYRFQVIASNNDGIWNDAGADLAFVRKPLFRETPWFYALIVITAVLSAYGFHLGRIRRLRGHQRTLRAREEHFRSLIEHGSDLITVVDLDGAVRYHSPSVTEVLGYEADQWVGRPLTDLVHAEDREAVLALPARAATEPGYVAKTTHRMQHMDGSWRIFESIWSAYLPEREQRLGILNSRDVTERQLAEERLQAALTKVLSGYIPICAHCKKIREERGEWTAVERYVHEHTEAQFSHTICESCVEVHYPEFAEEREPG